MQKPLIVQLGQHQLRELSWVPISPQRVSYHSMALLPMPKPNLVAFSISPEKRCIIDRKIACRRINALDIVGERFKEIILL